MTKSIPRVRVIEDIILRPRVMAAYAFLAITFISDIIFFKRFYSTKRRTTRIKLCEKKDRSPSSFRRKRPSLSLQWVFDSRPPCCARRERALLLAICARCYAQNRMRSAILGNHLKLGTFIWPFLSFWVTEST